jgi:hypothetical protein
MSRALMASLVLFLSLGASASGGSLNGDYVEVRTASVFAGACHANGEVMSTGNDAIMAWHITSGQWKGTALGGVSAIAVLKGDRNLALTSNRQSEVVVDTKASEPQAAAIVEIFREKYGQALGKIVAVRRAPVTFRHHGKEYAIDSPGVASLSVAAMPNNECCTMPSLVWYEPLVPLLKRKVGYTKNAVFDGGPVGDPWRRADENSAFYGAFSI